MMKKRILALVLVVAMIVPTTIIANAGSTPITMEYDDYYEIANGTVQVPTNDVVEWNETTRKLHAISVGQATITVDGTETSVTVNKAKLNVVLLAGQSNANGFNGTMVSGTTPITPDKGYGYYWHISETSGAWKDMKTSVDAAVAANPTTSVGFYPALTKEWYDLTGEKTAVIKNAYGGKPMRDWVNMTTGQLAANATTTLTYLQEALSEIDTSKFEIVRTGYYWLQGESDSFIYTHRENDQYITTEQYVTAYNTLHDAFVSALTINGIDAPIGGILACRTMNYMYELYTNLELCSVRAGHQDLANSNEDIFMASVITEDWHEAEKAVNFVSRTNIKINATTTTVGANDIHYTQVGYDILGLDAADNMYSAIVEKPTISDIKIIGQDGYSTYKNGDVINVNDHLRPVGDYNTCDENKAQVLVRPMPISAKCSEVTVTVKDSSGTPVENVMNNKGYIDVTKAVDSYTLTASAGNVEKTFTLTKTGITNAVNFEGNGGTGSMDTRRVVSGMNYELPSCEFTAPANKVFKCWNVNGAEILAGEKVLISEDTTLVAIWQSLPSEMLKVIAQSTQAPVTEVGKYQGKYVLRFTSTVEMDYDKYDYVGFELTYDDNGTSRKYEATTQSIFKRIETTTAGAELELSPKAVDPDSEYFFTAKWPVSENDKAKEYIVRAFFVQKGSTDKVYGPSRIVSVEGGLTSSDYAYVSFPLADGATAPAVGDTLTSGTTSATVVAVKNGYVHTTVSKSGLKALSNFTFTKDNQTVGTVLYRYYQSTVASDTSWYDVNPNASKFVIASLEELYGFATLRTDFAGKIVYLARDIQMNSGKATDWAAGSTSGVRTWTSIYKKTASGDDAWTDTGAWKGTFDAQGHSISGMYVPSSNTHGGLFYALDKDANIQNLKIVNSYVAGSYVGSVAATGAADLRNIYTDAIIQSSNLGGGILGERNDVPATNVLENCWFNGSVTSTGKWSGGIVGKTYDGIIHYKDCLVTGTITGAKYVGGIAGELTFDKLVFERCIVATSAISNGTAIGTLLGANNGTATAIASFGFGSACSNSSFGSGYRKVSDTQLTGTKAYNLLAENYDLYKVTNKDAVWTLTDGYPAISYWVAEEDRIDATDLVVDTPSSDPMSWYNDDTDKAGGSGDGSFIIRTAEEFYAFSEISQSYNFAGKTVKLANDIVLNEGNATDWAAGTNTSGLTVWTSIANEQWGAGFAGTFDGQGHTISGMYIPNGTEDGLFESVSKTGCIKNLKLTNSYVKSTWTGSVVAKLCGNMENVYSDAIVDGKGSRASGGLVGDFNEDSSGVVAHIKNCWFAGSVSNGNRTGGIAGQTVAKSGSDSTYDSYSILDCIVTGSVTGTTEYTGGLTGEINRSTTTIERCIILCSSLSAGTNNVGAIAGANNASKVRRIAGNYGLAANAFGNGTYTGGYTQCTEAQLTGNAAYQWLFGNHDLYSVSNPDGIWTLTNGYPGLSYWVNANDKVNADILVKAGNNLKNMNVAFFGDSLTYGDTGMPYAGAANGYTAQNYPYWVGQNLSVTVDNTGIPGDTAVRMWNSVVSGYDFSNTDMAIFMIGANGGIQEDFDTNYTNIATQIGAFYASVKKAIDDSNGQCKILIIHTLDYEGINTHLQKTRTNVNRIAQEFNLPVLDLYNQYPYAYDNATYYNSYDLIHLTPAGYKVMGQIVSTYIKYIWAE